MAALAALSLDCRVARVAGTERGGAVAVATITPAVAPSPKPAGSARWAPFHQLRPRIGPRIGDRTAALFEGRRVLLGDAGEATRETSPAPEPLDDLALVPTDARTYLVGISRHYLYRFDDPLGAPTVLAAFDGADGIGSVPNAAVVWIDGRPRFLDVLEGKEIDPPASLGAKKLLDVAFRSPQHGVAGFGWQQGGERDHVAMTHDGGKTWEKLAERYFQRFSFQGDDIVLDGSARVDFSGKSIGALDAAGGPPHLRWLRSPGPLGDLTPLREAVDNGYRADAGSALVAVIGGKDYLSYILQVDLETGALRDYASAGGRCQLAALDEARLWLGCVGPGESGRWKLYVVERSMAAIRRALAGGPPIAEGKTTGDEPSLQGSTRGAALVWTYMANPIGGTWTDEFVAVLPDGAKHAFERNGEHHRDRGANAATADGGYVELLDGHVEWRRGDGDRIVLPEIHAGEACHGSLNFFGEATRGHVRFNQGACVVDQPLVPGAQATVQVFAPPEDAAFSGQHGVATLVHGATRAWTTEDGGKTWDELVLPPQLDAQRFGATASEVGFFLGVPRWGFQRVGWGAARLGLGPGARRRAPHREVNQRSASAAAAMVRSMSASPCAAPRNAASYIEAGQ